MDMAVGFCIAVISLLCGALIAWAIFRGREALQLQNAITSAKSESQIQLVQLEERFRVADEDSKSANKERDEAEHRLSNMRAELEGSRQEQARLTERASRTPTLEREIQSLNERLAARTEELSIATASGAQKQQLVDSLKVRNVELDTQIEDMRQRLTRVSAESQASNERKAALEEQVSRIPGIETQVSQLTESLTAKDRELSELRESSGHQLGKLTAELNAERSASVSMREEFDKTKVAKQSLEKDAVRLSDELTELRARTDAERRSSEEKLALLQEAKEALGNQFKTLANEILEEKSKRFTEQNQTNIGALLEPLKARLSEFQGKVEEVYIQEGKDRSALAAQVKQLVDLNQVLSEDAKNLTNALKGSAKTQGNWGELILERVLESSGLRKGEEYLVQDSQVREDGTRAQPDVVINLPDDKKLVVDSKVSLNAYERYASAATDGERAAALRQHVESVRGHIRSLSEKQYQALYGRSLDFVLAFIPIEPAFMLAVANDNGLFMDAWRKNVLVVSPSTLLFVVRTVAHLWRQEQQSRNAQDIARRGGELYDKLCGFVDDLQQVGKEIRQAQKAYEQAHSKFATGKGNVIRQAELLRDMGVKPSKTLPTSLVEAASVDIPTAIVVPSGLDDAASPLDATFAANSDGER
ncbi:TPA: DNA recombination protein RmuC [Burkholderia cepacia ATCC 25416]|uniref:DNA recombination protein RmuC n=1 Tax=Burkholderia cepacia TaxID=292 RepID=UPI001CF0D84F|nr:DNA recombination protein RmuC [Burkholderia cepacia]HDR9767560.1 DNA recombination protein RmuC [Burkholderia cepacia ATCC 25416]MCA8074164.1 DNA recombination protein RmuC [Burkholderia cepacia]HDR9774762.1 DNA recombination protein RmuC [Burkholderia cepacia ATCC 25416]HDR9783720.1 DNA recombination protein RmuC [Burkholderia cepacia ATCC 25416]HDR9792642.1 DNA recombination protein RmuC [Burkholderia cepacia ATCC 25416]